ncbi:hypothetical protein FIBSPDRAFT_954549 [Athelia psychrophila]|uniref:Uncharacterized protein n=1 Tax=Athelia psychrophila TaxID=1759441 RepID=A0A166J1K1_9AGAM|nr:hypothetical protein FIBSPDRAFT_954549 [Fibularhizoctonia sp. CBS 109695]
MASVGASHDTLATPCRAAATTGAPICHWGHQKQPVSESAAPAAASATGAAPLPPPVAPLPPVAAPPPATMAPPAAVLPAGATLAGAAANPAPSPAASTPIHDHKSNPFIASPRAPQTPHGGGRRPALPSTEERYWAFSASGSPHPRSTPWSGPHSPAHRSPRVQKAFKKVDNAGAQNRQLPLIPQASYHSQATTDKLPQYVSNRPETPNAYFQWQNYSTWSTSMIGIFSFYQVTDIVVGVKPYIEDFKVDTTIGKVSLDADGKAKYLPTDETLDPELPIRTLHPKLDVTTGADATAKLASKTAS